MKQKKQDLEILSNDQQSYKSPNKNGGRMGEFGDYN